MKQLPAPPRYDLAPPLPCGHEVEFWPLVAGFHAGSLSAEQELELAALLNNCAACETMWEIDEAFTRERSWVEPEPSPISAMRHGVSSSLVVPPRSMPFADFKLAGWAGAVLLVLAMAFLVLTPKPEYMTKFTDAQIADPSLFGPLDTEGLKPPALWALERYKEGSGRRGDPSAEQAIAYFYRKGLSLDYRYRYVLPEPGSAETETSLMVQAASAGLDDVLRFTIEALAAEPSGHDSLRRELLPRHRTLPLEAQGTAPHGGPVRNAAAAGHDKSLQVLLEAIDTHFPESLSGVLTGGDDEASPLTDAAEGGHSASVIVLLNWMREIESAEGVAILRGEEPYGGYSEIDTFRGPLARACVRGKWETAEELFNRIQTDYGVDYPTLPIELLLGANTAPRKSLIVAAISHLPDIMVKPSDREKTANILLQSVVRRANLSSSELEDLLRGPGNEELNPVKLASRHGEFEVLAELFSFAKTDAPALRSLMIEDLKAVELDRASITEAQRSDLIKRYAP